MTFELFFDNGGGLLLQTPAFCHAYDGRDGAKQAADDVRALLAGRDTSEWDGNQPEYRRAPHSEDKIYRGVEVLAEVARIALAMAGGLTLADLHHGYMESDFFAAMRADRAA